MFVVFDQENYLTRSVSIRWFGEETLRCSHAARNKIGQGSEGLDGVKTYSRTLVGEPSAACPTRVPGLDVAGCGLKLCELLR